MNAAAEARKASSVALKDAPTYPHTSQVQTDQPDHGGAYRGAAAKGVGERKRPPTTSAASSAAKKSRGDVPGEGGG